MSRLVGASVYTGDVISWLGTINRTIVMISSVRDIFTISKLGAYIILSIGDRLFHSIVEAVWYCEFYSWLAFTMTVLFGSN